MDRIFLQSLGGDFQEMTYPVGTLAGCDARRPERRVTSYTMRGATRQRARQWRQRVCHFLKVALRLLMLPLAMAAALAFAQTSPATESLATRYPAGSIDSMEKVDSALREAAVQRAAIEERYAAEESECLRRFFANACSDAAKERRRVDLKQVRSIEIEANTFQRRARVIERDQAMAERAAQEEQENPERVKQQQENEAAAAQRAAARANNTPVRETNVPDERRSQHEAKLKKQRQQEAANAKKRADNIAEYEAKVKEAEEHQREVAARKQEKEKQKAAKDASTPDHQAKEPASK